ncbi:MAG: squalene/phytoene synthase family protein [Paracoccaceae bacterium]
MASGAAIAACATIVERDDPHLYATALFAPEPARSRLMVLYAFDCELSRAASASAESLIPRMRLQWWRDVIQEAATGGEPKAHEVAGPLARLIQTDPALISDIQELNGGDLLSRMTSGFECELSAPFTSDSFDDWARDRFGSRLGLAGSISPLGPEFGHDADDSAACRVLAYGLALRTAARMAASSGRTLLPDLRGEDLAALGRGEVSANLQKSLAERASASITALRSLRGTRRLRGEALVAHLPIRREARVIAKVARNPAIITKLPDEKVRPFEGLGLALAVWRRRW